MGYVDLQSPHMDAFFSSHIQIGGYDVQYKIQTLYVIPCVRHLVPGLKEVPSPCSSVGSLVPDMCGRCRTPLETVPRANWQRCSHQQSRMLRLLPKASTEHV